MEVLLPPTPIDFNYSSPMFSSPPTVPFAWEEKPGVPKSFYKFLQQDFTFDVRDELSSSDPVLLAEDLFDGGVIKPLYIKRGSLSFSSLSFSSSSSSSCSSSLPSARNKRTRSFSTHGGWECPWEEEHENTQKQQSIESMDTKPQLFSSFSAKGTRKWSFKDLFLFRSASDGRAMDRDPLKKYSAILRKHDEELKNSSLQSSNQSHIASGLGSKMKRRRRVSAHELHYKVNRAIANDMKKKTFLPYKQGILG